MNGKCGYSHPGTWGHECGKPGRWAQHRELEGEREWVGGFWYVRCDECRTYTGPDNLGLKRDRWEPYDPTVHVNRLRCNRWPNPPEIRSFPA